MPATYSRNIPATYPWDISKQHIPGTYPWNITFCVVQPPLYILTSVTSSQTCVTCTLPWNFPPHKFTFIWKSLTDLTLKSKNSLSWGFLLIQIFNDSLVTYCAVVMAPGIIFSFPTCFSRSVTSGRRLSFILPCRCTKAEYVCPTANRLDASLMSFKCYERKQITLNRGKSNFLFYDKCMLWLHFM